MITPVALNMSRTHYQCILQWNKHHTNNISQLRVSRCTIHQISSAKVCASDAQARNTIKSEVRFRWAENNIFTFRHLCNLSMQVWPQSMHVADIFMDYVCADAHAGFHDPKNTTGTKQYTQLTFSCCCIEPQPSFGSLETARWGSKQPYLHFDVCALRISKAASETKEGQYNAKGYGMMALCGSLPSNWPALASTVD